MAGKRLDLHRKADKQEVQYSGTRANKKTSQTVTVTVNYGNIVKTRCRLRGGRNTSPRSSLFIEVFELKMSQAFCC